MAKVPEKKKEPPPPQEPEKKKISPPRNEFLVGLRGDSVGIGLIVSRQLSKERALAFAAWIVAIADEPGESGPSKFQEYLESLQS